jgi:predicted AlkP superfamily pyrophosphatase or phosphodiesterase
LKEVQKYIAQYWPYWDRKGGADHLWVLTDDHGACDEFGTTHRVTEIENSIFLTHFGYRGGYVSSHPPHCIHRG